MDDIKIIDTNSVNILDHGVCGYKNIKTPGFPEKIEWVKERFREGMKIKTLYSENGGTQGMIEYIPGEYCWRPVEASGYMFIHCVFVGFKKTYKGKGYASLLLDECEKDAKKENMHGVAVVTRKGSFMVGKEIFLKRGYQVVDSAPSDFDLLVKRYDRDAPLTKFKWNQDVWLKRYSKGLTIIRAYQCPYTVKNVNEIGETAENIFGLKPNIIELKSYKEAQNSPCAFGVFCILYEGNVIAEHPISNTRFNNIMKKILN